MKKKKKCYPLETRIGPFSKSFVAIVNHIIPLSNSGKLFHTGKHSRPVLLAGKPLPFFG